VVVVEVVAKGLDGAAPPDMAEKGFGRRPFPFPWTPAVVDFEPNGVGEKDRGFEAEENAPPPKTEVDCAWVAAGQPLPPKVDIVSSADSHLLRIATRGDC